jgi:REP element-mobilizing transposase RayT
MPRRPRIQAAGAAYHVTANGVARTALFRDDVDRERFLDLLAGVVARFEWTCHAYCVMTTHYHLLVQTPVPNLSAGMQRLNSCYVQQFNRRHREEGARLKRRFDDVLVKSESHALELFRYVSMNPVRAGICSRPERWKWSSYAAHIGQAPRPPFLTLEWVRAYFGSNPRRAAERLASFVEDTAEPPALVKGSDPGHDRHMASGYTGPERRSGKDRRSGQDRRKNDRRSGPGDDRRSGKDRRSGEDRREDKKD